MGHAEKIAYFNTWIANLQNRELVPQWVFDWMRQVGEGDVTDRTDLRDFETDWRDMYEWADVHADGDGRDEYDELEFMEAEETLIWIRLLLSLMEATGAKYQVTDLLKIEDKLNDKLQSFTKDLCVNHWKRHRYTIDPDDSDLSESGGDGGGGDDDDDIIQSKYDIWSGASS